jgi:hypothetical protein
MTKELTITDEIASDHVEISDAEKLDYVFRKMLEIDQLVEQAGPLLVTAAPLLEQFAGQAASPIGRIAASFLR